MSVSSEPRIISFKADGAIPKGSAVKAGSDKDHVAIGAANTDRCVGVAMTAADAAEDQIEVALQGGGAKGLLGEAVSFGNDLVSHTDGTLVKPNAEGDQIVGRAMQDGDAGDVIGMEVYHATAHAAQ